MTLIDIKALVAFLETNEDEVCVKDLLYMVLGLLTQKPFVSSFIEHLNSLGGITILLNLIRRSVGIPYTPLIYWLICLFSAS